jgi:hypothetical protein
VVEVDLLANTKTFIFAAEVTSHLEETEIPKVERFVRAFNTLKAVQPSKRAYGKETKSEEKEERKRH